MAILTVNLKNPIGQAVEGAEVIIIPDGQFASTSDSVIPAQQRKITPATGQVTFDLYAAQYYTARVRYGRAMSEKRFQMPDDDVDLADLQHFDADGDIAETGLVPSTPIPGAGLTEDEVNKIVDRAIAAAFDPDDRIYLIGISVDPDNFVIGSLPDTLTFTFDNSRVFGSGQVDIFYNVEIAGDNSARQRWATLADREVITHTVSDSQKVAIGNKINEGDNSIQLLLNFYDSETGGRYLGSRTTGIDLVQPPFELPKKTQEQLIDELNIELEPSAVSVSDVQGSYALRIDNADTLTGVWYEIWDSFNAITNRKQWTGGSSLSFAIDKTRAERTQNNRADEGFEEFQLRFYDAANAGNLVAFRRFPLDLIAAGAGGGVAGGSFDITPKTDLKWVDSGIALPDNLASTFVFIYIGQVFSGSLDNNNPVNRILGARIDGLTASAVGATNTVANGLLLSGTGVSAEVRIGKGTNGNLLVSVHTSRGDYRLIIKFM